MSKSTITREESVQAVFDLKAGYTLGLADVEILKRVARMALAAMDSEPVGEVIEVGDALLVEWHKNLEEGAKLYTTPQAPVIPFGLHLDTQKLVTDFCTALAEKLYKAQLKYGYDADWKQDGWPSQCQAHFHQHIAKGDPRDVAAYCAFMWYHGWKTEAAQPAPVVPAGKTMPNPLSMYAVDAVAAIAEVKGWNACRAAMLQESQKSAGESNNCRRSEKVQDLLAGNCRENGNSSTNNFRENAETSTNRSREHFISLCNEFWNWSEMDLVCSDDRGYELRMEWDGKVFKHPVTQALWRMYQAAPVNSPVIPDGWVACSERLPDETQPVITVSDGGVVQRTVYQFCEGVWSDWYEQYDDVTADAFTHWMPLPAAPQEVR